MLGSSVVNDPQPSKLPLQVHLEAGIDPQEQHLSEKAVTLLSSQACAHTHTHKFSFTHLSLLLRQKLINSFVHFGHLFADISEAERRHRRFHFILENNQSVRTGVTVPVYDPEGTSLQLLSPLTKPSQTGCP